MKKFFVNLIFIKITKLELDEEKMTSVYILKIFNEALHVRSYALIIWSIDRK